MSKRTVLTLDEIASWDNVSQAVYRACRGKAHRSDVKGLKCDPLTEIAKISESLRRGKLPIGTFKSFTIHDPKKRIIHAAPLQDRIAHHALIHFMEPSFERALLPSVFACRVGKGVHAAIAYAQKQSRRFSWVLHVDIKHYFPNIDHDILLGLLEKRFKGSGMALVQSVIRSHGSDEGKGLPIGALSSQHFANYYVHRLDRWSLTSK